MLDTRDRIRSILCSAAGANDNGGGPPAVVFTGPVTINVFRRAYEPPAPPTRPNPSILPPDTRKRLSSLPPYDPNANKKNGIDAAF